MSELVQCVHLDFALIVV